MLANDRYSKILEILEKDNSVKSSHLVEVLGVSLETIRRDLAFLEKEGELARVHGGAILKTKEISPVTCSSPTGRAEEREIAEIAVENIKEGETIALNNGAINVEIVKGIRDSQKSVTIITNSLPVMNELASCEDINVILAGGVYNKEKSAFLGDITAFYLDVFSVDRAFICSEGISLKKGITDSSMDKILVSKKMIDIASEVVVLTVSSNFETNSLMKTCNLNDVDLVITDSNLDSEIKKAFINNKVKLLTEIKKEVN